MSTQSPRLHRIHGKHNIIYECRREKVDSPRGGEEGILDFNLTVRINNTQVFSETLLKYRFNEFLTVEYRGGGRGGRKGGEGENKPTTHKMVKSLAMVVD